MDNSELTHAKRNTFKIGMYNKVISFCNIYFQKQKRVPQPTLNIIPNITDELWIQNLKTTKMKNLPDCVFMNHQMN